MKSSDISVISTVNILDDIARTEDGDIMHCRSRLVGLLRGVVR